MVVTLLAGVAAWPGPAGSGELRDPFAPDAQARFLAVRDGIELRSEQYDLDWTWVAGIAFQESGFDQAARGPGGHIGVMQIAPATASSVPVGIRGISSLDPNIHAGVRYLRFIVDKHFSEPGIAEEDRMRMAVAAYQAGPLNIDQARGWARVNGLDADRWFGGVEEAVRQLFGEHTVDYVRDVSAYRDAFWRAFVQNELSPG
jgi:membrane-bound lytic murein transglycosylase MltF